MTANPYIGTTPDLPETIDYRPGGSSPFGGEFFLGQTVCCALIDDDGAEFHFEDGSVVNVTIDGTRDYQRVSSVNKYEDKINDLGSEFTGSENTSLNENGIPPELHYSLVVDNTRILTVSFLMDAVLTLRRGDETLKLSLSGTRYTP